MRYGHKELLYAEPFADALVNDLGFRSWVLKKTKFAEFADEARLLHREMMALRSPTTQYWWRSHFNMSCDCPGCKGGNETDLLAIFATTSGSRFALHVEVKHPNDTFKPGKDQAALYCVRAQCWVTTTPAKVLPHSAFTTVLLFSNPKRWEYAPHLGHFKTLITFEEIEKEFPNVSVWATLAHKPDRDRRQRPTVFVKYIIPVKSARRHRERPALPYPLRVYQGGPVPIPVRDIRTNLRSRT